MIHTKNKQTKRAFFYLEHATLFSSRRVSARTPRQVLVLGVGELHRSPRSQFRHQTRLGHSVVFFFVPYITTTTVLKIHLTRSLLFAAFALCYSLFPRVRPRRLVAPLSCGQTV